MAPFKRVCSPNNGSIPGRTFHAIHPFFVKAGTAEVKAGTADAVTAKAGTAKAGTAEVKAGTAEVKAGTAEVNTGITFILYIYRVSTLSAKKRFLS
jgi:hypothetical protein